MKTTIQVQFNNTSVETKDIEKQVKEALKAQNIKMNTIDTLEVYYKPEEKAVYYVATSKTGEVTGNEEPLTIA
ncbi:MAG: DUF6465 family protein [Erysipelotrichaceae bacterium]|nr:DUF6465 family protein [Erysipelotrichaceae bacterium]